jgi:hypothetical protein
MNGSHPPELERRVVDALKARGLIRPRRSFPTFAVAAALAVFVSGVGLGRATMAPVVAPDPGARVFALLLYPGTGVAPTPEAVQARVREYGQWARELRSRGQMIGGEKLKAASAVHLGGAPNGSDAGESLQGFFLVRARTLADAERIARTCPHLRHGGAIALREVDPT